MRKISLKIFPLLLTIAGTFCLSSCIDESIDMDNLSEDMRIGNSMAAPLGEINMNIEKLLENYEPSEGSNISIGSKNGMITLFYQDSMSYENPTELSFDNSSCLTKLFTGSDLNPAITIPVAISGNTEYTASQTFSITKITDDPEAIIDSIYFYYSNIKLTLNTDIVFPAGSDMEIRVKLRNPTTGLFDKALSVSYSDNSSSTPKITYLTNFAIATTGANTSEIPMEIIFKPNGNTITVNPTDFIDIQFEPLNLNDSRFVVFGNFNYSKTYQPINEKTFDGLDLYKFLPEGSFIKPVDPEINLTVSTNIGIPLDINIESLKSQELDQAGNIISSKTATFTGANGSKYTINRALNNGEKGISNITFNKEPENGNLDDLFTIKLNNAYFDINFMQNLTDASGKKQFLRSDSKIDVKVDVSLPIWLDVDSKLAYSDTLKDVNLNEMLEDDQISNLVLKFKNTNSLALGLDITIKMLDENFIEIPSANSYSYHVDAANTDTDGTVLAEKISYFNIRYDKNINTELKSTKHIKFEVEALGLNNGKIKIRPQDGLKIKLGAYTNVGIDLNSNNK